MPQFEGTITAKRHDLNFTDYPYGDIYVDNLVFAVNKATYNNFQIGQRISGDYSTHSTMNGIAFQNLLNFEILSSPIEFITIKSSRKADKEWIENQKTLPFSNLFIMVRILFSLVFCSFLNVYKYSNLVGLNWFLSSIVIAVFSVLFFINLMDLSVRSRNLKLESSMFIEFILRPVEYVCNPSKDLFELIWYDAAKNKIRTKLNKEQFDAIKLFSKVKITELSDRKFISVVGLA